jgi:two-component system, OmpR family, heavy metal sensor histidine kinase CusS
VIESCLEEAVRLSDLIGDLLFLARAEKPLGGFATVSGWMWANCWRGVREYYEASAADGRVSLTTDGRRPNRSSPNWTARSYRGQ